MNQKNVVVPTEGPKEGLMKKGLQQTSLISLFEPKQMTLILAKMYKFPAMARKKSF